VKALRTPDDCFVDFPFFSFRAKYLRVDNAEGGLLRLHCLDEGDAGALIDLMT
jgi:hypothetical protein